VLEFFGFVLEDSKIVFKTLKINF